MARPRDPRDGDLDSTDVFAVPLPRAGDDTAAVRRPPTGGARLVCVTGADLGRVIPLGTSSLTIGRGSADVSLRSHDVSRLHARISAHGEGLVIQDLGSVNGTFVNDARIGAGLVPLAIGDHVRIGVATMFVVDRHDELEDRMQRLQRLEAMAAVVAGLAHDFNNALAVIAGNVDVIAGRLPPDDPELGEMIADVRHATDNASSLARRLRTFGRQGPASSQPIELAQLVTETLALVRRVVSSGIATTVELAPGVIVHGGRDELEQVLINLFLNARDAMPTGGTLRVATSLVRVTPAEAALHHVPPAGHFAELVVSDTGVGMSQAVVARAFEPYFTTKAEGTGTGLGLAIVYSIVRRHGGTVFIESAIGRGTTFRIWLPVSPPAD